MQKQAGSIIDDGKESLAPETLGDCSALSSKGNFSFSISTLVILIQSSVNPTILTILY